MATRIKTKKNKKLKKRKIGGVKSTVNKKSSSKNTTTNFKILQRNAQSMLNSITDPERKKRIKTLLSQIDIEINSRNNMKKHEICS